MSPSYNSVLVSLLYPSDQLQLGGAAATCVGIAALCDRLVLAGMKLLQEYGVTANELRIVGGGSKNNLWRQIIADSFQLPLRFPTEPESAALGGALQAAAVYHGAAVGEYISENEPPLAPEVGP